MGNETEKIYNILIISFIIGLIIAVTFTFWIPKNLYDNNPSFSELFFLKTKKLPNLVKINQSYNYSFGIKNNEDKKQEYSYDINLELYNLYNFTEEKYHCIGRNREKIFLEWTNKTNNLSLLNQNNHFSEIENLVIFPNYKNKINWSKYTIEFKFEQFIGKGKLIIFFRNETNLKYSITFDLLNNETKFNNKTVGKIPIIKRENNWVKIEIKNNTITSYLNEKLIFSKDYSYNTGGQIGLASQDQYFGIGYIKLYKDSYFKIPDIGTIIDYKMIGNTISKKTSNLRDLREKSVPLIRSFNPWNETIDCEKESFYCEYFDLANDISFYLEEKNITKVVKKVPVIDNINYVLFPSRNTSFVNWTDFTFYFTHDQLKIGSKGTIILTFSDKWAIMITRNNSYYIRPYENGTIIDEIRNPQKPNQNQDEVFVNITKNTIHFLINNESVFKKITPKDYTNGSLSIYVKNAFFFINPVQIKNQNEVCKNPYTFSFCELTLEVSQGIKQQNEETESFTINYIDNSKKENRAPIFLPPLFNNVSYNKTYNTSYNQPLQNEIIKAKFNIPKTNPYIPDTKTIFNSTTTKIINSTNFSLSYSYKSLGGARAMEIGFQDKAGNELISMLTSEIKNKVYFHYYDGKNITGKNKSIYINKSIGHSLKIEIIKKNISYILDGKEIYKITNANITTGSFFVGSFNTYSEWYSINWRKKALSRRFSIIEDPCELKTIYKKTITKTINLTPLQTLISTNSLNIKRDFDFGKITIIAKPTKESNANNTREIYFWVMRDDS